MKIIRTARKREIAEVDITRIAQEMVNIYHGRKYYKDGVVDHAATDDYLSWREGDADYSFTPNRGFIYFNYTNGLSAEFKKSRIEHSLFREFCKLNTWGWRDDAFVDHMFGSNQFTLEKLTEPQLSNMQITIGHPFYLKNADKFTWIISEKNMFQYGVDGKFPKFDNLVASLSTITIDIEHSIDLPDGYACTGFPRLNKAIEIVPKFILLSRIAGIGAHLYTALGGASPENKIWGVFNNIIAYDTAMWLSTEPVHLVKTLQDLATATATNSAIVCTICRIRLFDQYYQVAVKQNAEKRTNVCKFCAHYNTGVSAALISGDFRVAIANASRTTETIIEELHISDTERIILSRLHKEMQSGTIINARVQEITHSNFKGALGVLIMGGSPNVIGVYDPIFHDDLEDIHLLPDDTKIFQYKIVWS